MRCARSGEITTNGDVITFCIYSGMTLFFLFISLTVTVNR